MKYTPLQKKSVFDDQIEDMIENLYTLTMSGTITEKKKDSYRRTMRFYEPTPDEIEAFEKYWTHNKDAFFKMPQFKEWLMYHREKNRDKALKKDTCKICQNCQVIEFEKPDADGIPHLYTILCRCHKDHESTPSTPGVYVNDLTSLEKSWEGSTHKVTDSFRDMTIGRELNAGSTETVKLEHIRFSEDFIHKNSIFFRGLRRSGLSVEEIADVIIEKKECIPESYLATRKDDKDHVLLNEIAENIFQSV